MSVCDYKGQYYDTVKDMCKNYNISESTFKSRKRRGWSLEECLSPVGTRDKRRDVSVDHFGFTYDSFEDMCWAYGKDIELVIARLSRNWSLADALTVPFGKRPSKYNDSQQVVEDGKGNVFESVSEMCKYYGVNVDTYKKRVKAGKSPEEALQVNDEFAVNVEESILVTDPKAAYAFDKERNKGSGVKPEYIKRDSRRAYWWKCEYGHIVKMSVYDYAQYGCPECNALNMDHLFGKSN